MGSFPYVLMQYLLGLRSLILGESPLEPFIEKSYKLTM